MKVQRLSGALAASVIALAVGCDSAERVPSATHAAESASPTTNESTIENKAATPMNEPDAAAARDPGSVMRELRNSMLTTPPEEFGIRPTPEYPIVYGALMEWPIGDQTATVVSFCDGNASLYTTSTFGVLGGIGHASVRAEAEAFVQAAAKYFDEARATSEYPYPKSDRVRFYLLTFSGVRVIETDHASMEKGTNKYAELFGRGHAVLTQLRLVSEQDP